MRNRLAIDPAVKCKALVLYICLEVINSKTTYTKTLEPSQGNVSNARLSNVKKAIQPYLFPSFCCHFLRLEIFEGMWHWLWRCLHSLCQFTLDCHLGYPLSTSLNFAFVLRWNSIVFLFESCYAQLSTVTHIYVYICIDHKNINTEFSLSLTQQLLAPWISSSPFSLDSQLPILNGCSLTLSGRWCEHQYQ